MIFGSLGLLLAAGGLLAAGIADSNTGLLIGSFVCTLLAGILLLITYASARSGAALGAQAGEARLRQVVLAGGFTRFRRATATPFNLVLEARP